jgi:hypothetical protein
MITAPTTATTYTTAGGRAGHIEYDNSSHVVEQISDGSHT